MGNHLIIAGVAGLAVTAVATPIAVAVLSRQLKKLKELVRQESEE